MSRKDSDRFISFGNPDKEQPNKEQSDIEDISSKEDSIGISKKELTEGLETKEEKEQMEAPFTEEEEAGETPVPNNLNTGRFGIKPKNKNSNVIKIPRRHTRQIAIGLIVIIVLAAAFAVFWHFRSFDSYEVISSTDKADESSMEYLAFQGGFVKYNVDGITYEDKTGSIVWTEAFNMTSPKVAICKDYVAIADIGNNQFTLYNSVKKVNSVTTDFPISDITVASQGLVTVVLEDEKVDYITAFDDDGGKVLEIKTTINKNGYPLAIALSEDGTKLVAAYVIVNNTKVESVLTFYNFGNVGKNEVDRLVGTISYEEELFPRIAFVDNDTVVAYSDERIVLYSMKEKPKEILNKKTGGRVKSIFYNTSYVGYIANSVKTVSSKAGEEHKEVSKDEQEDRYRLRAFTLNGNEVVNRDIDYYYTNIHASEKEIILIGKKSARVYNYNGRVRFKSDFENGIMDMFPGNSRNQYILLTPSKNEVIHLK